MTNDATREVTIYEALKELGLTVSEVEKNPGKIVKYFREQMVYEDQVTGKLKHWSQQQLGRVIGLTKVQVCNMENHNEGLDSIERRKTLAAILKIPPALLGLVMFDQSTQTLDNLVASNILISRHAGVSDEEIDLYRNALDVYANSYKQGAMQTAIPALERWIARISSGMEGVNSSCKTVLLPILWEYHTLIARSYRDDVSDFTRTLAHLNEAREIAEVLNDSDLKAASYYRLGDFWLIQRKLVLAKADFETALIHARGAGEQTKGAVYMFSALTYSMHDTIDLAEQTTIQKLLDKAEACAGVDDDNSSIEFGTSEYLRDRADVLISLGRYGKALEFLDDAEDSYGTSDKRQATYLNILRSECFIKRKRPDFDRAVMLLADVLDENKSTRNQYQIKYVERLCKILAASSYGNSPEVVDLGMKLRELRLKKSWLAPVS